MVIMAGKAKKRYPVILEGRILAKNWWGKAWNANLERYADYSNRIGRGKSYVRGGRVVDLQIEKGMINARVQGSRRTPYKIIIRIAPLRENIRRKIIDRCGHKISNIEALVNGDLPDEMADIFTSEEGLFPKPKDIEFDCSCPDWADMCKHVAAVLYGIGSRFDNDPMLFFELRDIDVNEFIRRSVDDKLKDMLKNAEKGSGRVIEDEKLEKLFGVL